MNGGRSPLRVLSLGAGVQSTTVLLMSCVGQLPRLDAAVFADTGWEPSRVYSHLEWLEAEARSHGIPVHRVSHGDLRAEVLRQIDARPVKQSWTSIPLYVLNPDGSKGMIQRQCTRAYKVRPVDRFIRTRLLGLRPKQRAPANAVDHWFGISCDEMLRIRHSSVRWKRHEYPLCNYPAVYIDRPMTRADCIAWLDRNYPGRDVPRSACIGCPFRSDAEWRWLREQAPCEWNEMVGIDHAVRRLPGMHGSVFFHPRRIPLDAAVPALSATDVADKWINECTGLCGI